MKIFRDCSVQKNVDSEIPGLVVKALMAMAALDVAADADAAVDVAVSGPDAESIVWF